MKSPQIINLETAVDHIKQACDGRPDRPPFFFMVGAGLSYPSIPLASEITRHCKETALKYKKTDEPLGTLPIDVYEHWLKQAYPHAKPRQEYLRKLIENKPISPANFRLAHLLLDKKITNLVVTPNFDDFLSRALTLFGKPHIVCDHPQTVDRIDPEQDDLQIIHVHGTYWFYDCCNLRGEIKTRAKPSSHTTQTMASLLDRILSNHAPLVIGYSGWEDDVFMTALKRRLKSPLPYNLYWFCYRQSEIDELPDELKSSHQVYFVVLPETKPDLNPSGIDSYGAEKQKTESASFKAKLSLEKEPSTLPAKDVLDRLIQIFALDAPEFTKDPLGFFAKHLRISLIHDKMEDDKSDIYLISSVIEKIERAKTYEEEAVKTIETELENIRDAIRRLKYRKVIKLASKIDQSKLSVNQLRELMDSTYKAALGVSDNFNEELDGYDLVIKIGYKLIKRNNRDSTLQKQVAMALFKKGFGLGTLNRNEEAIAVYDEVVKRFGSAKEPALLEKVAMVLVNKGVALLYLEKKEDSQKTFFRIIETFGTHQVLNIQLCMVVALAGLERFKESMSLLQQLAQKNINGARRCLPNLELLSSTPQSSDEMKQFFEEAKKMLEEAQKTGSRVIA